VRYAKRKAFIEGSVDEEEEPNDGKEAKVAGAEGNTPVETACMASANGSEPWAST